MKPPCGQSRCGLRVWPEAPPGGQWTTGFKEEGLSSCSKAGVRWWHPALEGVNVLSRSSLKSVDWGGASAGSFFDVSESLGGIDTFNIFSLLTILHLHIQKNAFPFTPFFFFVYFMGGHPARVLPCRELKGVLRGTVGNAGAQGLGDEEGQCGSRCKNRPNLQRMSTSYRSRADGDIRQEAGSPTLQRRAVLQLPLSF